MAPRLPTGPCLLVGKRGHPCPAAPAARNAGAVLSKTSPAQCFAGSWFFPRLAYGRNMASEGLAHPGSEHGHFDAAAKETVQPSLVSARTYSRHYQAARFSVSAEREKMPIEIAPLVKFCAPPQ